MYDDPAFKIAELIKKSKKTCVLTGAGISTESGIADFRSPSGLWSKYDPMKLLSTEVLFNTPEVFYSDSIRILEPMTKAKPNRAHEIIAELEASGLIHCIVTQNIDGFHVDAGSKCVYEVHGHLRSARCISCHEEISFAALVEKTSAGEVPPRCEVCGGLQRTNVVLFGDSLPECFEDAYYDAASCDLMIVIGSSLAVAPVNMLPGLASRAVIINIGRTEFDQRAFCVYNEKASVALEKILKYIG